MANKIIGKNLLKSITPPDNFGDIMVPAGGTYGTDDSVLSMDITPQKVFSILRAARSGKIHQLYQLYRLMETTDARYGGLIGSMKSAISGMPVKVAVKDGRSEKEKQLAQEYAAAVEESLSFMDTHRIVRMFIDAVSYGARPFELIWEKIDLGYSKEMYIVSNVRPIPVSKLMMETDKDDKNYGEIKIIYNDDPYGKALDWFPEGKVILVEESEAIGEYDMVGIARRVLGWWLAKIFTQQWWVEYTETYGQPWRVGRYPQGASNRAKGAMKSFLENLGRNSWGLFPENMSLQLIEANRAGTVTTYMDLINMANKEMTVAVIGQLDTVGDQRQGSYARTEITNNIRHEILQNVAETVAKGFDQIVHYILKFNFGEDYDRRMAPRVMPMVVNVTHGKEKVETYKLMQEQGVPVPVEQYYLQTGVPTPKKSETIIVNNQVVDFDEFHLLPRGGSNGETERQDSSRQNASGSGSGGESNGADG